MTLIAHCGGEIVSREQVLETRTPPPNLASGWTPLAHHKLISQTEKSLEAVGFSVQSQEHALAKDGARYFGVMELKHANDHSMLVGLRNSHDMSFSAGLSCGARVFVCDNLSFSGEVMLARKHTRFIMRDLPALVARALEKISSLGKEQDLRFDRYKTYELSLTGADHLILQLLRARIVMPSQLGKLVQEWDTPSHPEFAKDGRTLWRLFNAATDALKARKQAMPRATNMLQGVLDAVCRGAESGVPSYEVVGT